MLEYEDTAFVSKIRIRKDTDKYDNFGNTVEYYSV